MGGTMRIACLVVVGVLILLSSGCGSGTSNSPITGKPFLNEKKELEPRQEWNREVISRSGGTISFRVASQGPFAVTVVTAKGYQALKGDDPKALDKADVLLTVDSKGPTHEGKVTLPAGSSYFIIENQADKKAEVHLQCFPPS
jgi:hypothetical protein